MMGVGKTILRTVLQQSDSKSLNCVVLLAVQQVLISKMFCGSTN